MEINMKIGIYTYGNLGRGVEAAVSSAHDSELMGIFTRRCPDGVKSPIGTRVFSVERAPEFKGEIDVMIICGGSSQDLPEMTPRLARDFNVVDSFDTHKNIEEHFEACDAAAREGGHIAVISAGWDPGIFSLARLFFSSFYMEGSSYTLWGPGVSQGHSDAVRRIEGVADARQYTIPKDDARALISADKYRRLTAEDLHKRVCYVATERGADKKRIEREIKSMDGYFSGYETDIKFVETAELLKEHSKLSHGGSVISHSGEDGEDKSIAELSLKLGSNPRFTGAVLLAYARAAYKISSRGHSGARSVFDIAPAELSPLTDRQMRKSFL